MILRYRDDGNGKSKYLPMTVFRFIVLIVWLFDAVLPLLRKLLQEGALFKIGSVSHWLSPVRWHAWFNWLVLLPTRYYFCVALFVMSNCLMIPYHTTDRSGSWPLSFISSASCAEILHPYSFRFPLRLYSELPTFVRTQLLLPKPV